MLRKPTTVVPSSIVVPTGLPQDLQQLCVHLGYGVSMQRLSYPMPLLQTRSLLEALADLFAWPELFVGCVYRKIHNGDAHNTKQSCVPSEPSDKRNWSSPQLLTKQRYLKRREYSRE